jgi:hypothetical protein
VQQARQRFAGRLAQQQQREALERLHQASW